MCCWKIFSENNEINLSIALKGTAVGPEQEGGVIEFVVLDFFRAQQEGAVVDRFYMIDNLVDQVALGESLSRNRLRPDQQVGILRDGLGRKILLLNHGGQFQAVDVVLLAVGRKESPGYSAECTHN